MTRKRNPERFLKQVTTYRFRDKRTGHYVSKMTKAGTVRKNVAREKMLTLLTVKTDTGEIRRYGSIRERSRRTLSETEVKDRNLYIKMALRRQGVFEKIAKLNATGARITIIGKGPRNKDTAVRADVVFDHDKRNDVDYLMRVILGKLMARLGERRLRVSDEQISSHKKYRQMRKVRVKVEYFTDGGTGEWDETEEEEDEDSFTSEMPKKSRRKGKRKSRSKKSSRSTRRTTRKGRRI